MGTFLAQDGWTSRIVALFLSCLISDKLLHMQHHTPKEMLLLSSVALSILKKKYLALKYPIALPIEMQKDLPTPIIQ